jgi:hypothetical protein
MALPWLFMLPATLLMVRMPELSLPVPLTSSATFSAQLVHASLRWFRWLSSACDSAALSVKTTRIGAGEGIRTLDFNLGKVALYP